MTRLPRIDGRAHGERELFMELRALFLKHADEDIEFTVLVRDRPRAQRVKAFSKFSRLSAEVQDEGDHAMVLISGSPCRCGT